MSDRITRSSSLSAGAADSGPAETVEVPTLLAASGDAERQSLAAAQDVPGIRRRNDHRHATKKRSNSHRARRKAGATTFSSKRRRGTETSPRSSTDVDADEEDIVSDDNVDAVETDGARPGSALAEAAVQGNAAGINAASTVTISNARGRAESPITALQDDNIPNLYLGTMDPMQTDTEADAPVDPKVEAHRSLFYQQIEEHYKTTNTRALMSRDEMDAMVRLIKEDTKTKKSSEYKLKRDFAVITFGEKHYSVVRRKDVTDKDVVDVSELPRYCCYDDLFGAIHKCHVDQEGHSGIRKTEAAVKRHYVNISRAMVEKFIVCCSCQLDRKHPGKPDDVKPIISSTFNSRGQVDLINMTAYPDGEMKWILHYQDHYDKMSYLRAMSIEAPLPVTNTNSNVVMSLQEVNTTLDTVEPSFPVDNTNTTDDSSKDPLPMTDILEAPLEAVNTTNDVTEPELEVVEAPWEVNEAELEAVNTTNNTVEAKGAEAPWEVNEAELEAVNTSNDTVEATDVEAPWEVNEAELEAVNTSNDTIEAPGAEAPWEVLIVTTNEVIEHPEEEPEEEHPEEEPEEDSYYEPLIMNPDEPLRAGDVIFYWSPIFVCGTPRARRVMKTLSHKAVMKSHSPKEVRQTRIHKHSPKPVMKSQSPKPVMSLQMVTQPRKMKRRWTTQIISVAAAVAPLRHQLIVAVILARR
jgi:hypothetical protein